MGTGITGANKTAELAVLGTYWYHSRMDEKTVTVRVKDCVSPSPLCDVITGIVRCHGAWAPRPGRTASVDTRADYARVS